MYIIVQFLPLQELGALLAEQNAVPLHQIGLSVFQKEDEIQLVSEISCTYIIT